MDAAKLEHFRQILLAQLREHSQNALTEQAAALELSDDGVKDSVGRSQMEVNRDIAFKRSEQESQVIADIDQALLRIKEGSYGKCASCGEEIDVRRLEALPTARYDAVCQTLMETREGSNTISTL